MRQLALTIALGFGQIVAFASSFYLLGVLGDPIARSLQLAPTIPFDLLSGAFLASALVGPLAGRWLDRRGGREVLMASSLVFAIGLVAIASAGGVASLGVGVLVLGLGMSIGLYGTPYALLVQVHGDGARPWITAVALMGGLGSSVGWLANEWLLQQVGWRGAVMAWAGLHLFVCLPLAVILAPPHAALSHATRRPGDGPAIHWDRRMVQVAVLFASAWFVSTCISAHLPRLLARLGLSAPKAAATASLLGLAAVSARLFELLVLRRFSPVITARAAALFHPVGAMAVLAFGASLAPVFVAGQGLGNGMLSVASGALPLVLFGAEGYARRTAWLNLPARLAQAAGPALFALVLARSPGLALALTSGVCGVMFLMTFGLSPRRDRLSAAE